MRRSQSTSLRVITFSLFPSRSNPCDVLDVLDLMLELAQPFLLGADQFPAPLASLLAAGNLRVHLGHELVAILPLAAQQAPIEQVSAFPIVADRRMHLTQVDAR